ncbi:MAG: hypothetical protein QM754_12195 [Tepidisphaeraceae bacterium]
MKHSNLTAAVTAVLLAVSPALAVKTQHWTQTSADDFNKGTATGVLATSGGQLRLSRQVDALLPKDKHFDAVQAVIEAPDGGIVFAAFPSGEVFSLKDGKLTTLATFKDQTVTALAYDNAGKLLIGVGGEQAKLVRVDKPGAAPATVAEPKDASYIWAILPDGDSTYLATGPNGGVFKIDSAGKGADAPLAELSGDNVLCLVADKNNLYAGTDTDACVYKIDKKTAKPYVLYEAEESEISALAWDNAGNLLAATSETQETPATPATAAGTAAAGGKHANAVEIPGKKPTPPKPPEEKPGDAIPQGHLSSPAKIEPTSAPANEDDAEKPNSGGTGNANGSSGTNAVYRIDPRGLVTEVFRKNVIIYGLAVRDDSIVLATGDDGAVYEINPDTDEEAVLLRADAPDVTGLVTAKDGSLLVATSNSGQVYKLSAGFAKEGSYDSDTLDAGVPSTFGQLHLLGTLPDGTALTVQTRAGNVADPDGGQWADWTAPVPAKAFVPVTSSPARFLQYRLNFTTTDASKTALVDEVDVAYQKPNLPPKITGVAVSPGLDAGQINVTWEAFDPNEDDLKYGLYVRPAGRGPWMKIAEDLTDSTHTWQAKNVPDGQYELKVTATDAASNAPGEGKEASRISDGVLVDNTPPVIGDVKTASEGGKTTVTFRVVDRAGTVAGVETSLEQVDHWQKRLPDDTIADSPEERYTVSLPGLGKGQHALLIKATDARGNSSFETITVTVP